MSKDNNSKKLNLATTSILIGVAVMILTFLNIFASVRLILQNNITVSNFIAYIILSLVLGSIAGIFFYFKFQLAFYTFLLGILVGFYQLYSMFLNGMDGWGDLAGFLSFLTWIIIGFILGITFQFFQFLYKKRKK